MTNASCLPTPEVIALILGEWLGICTKIEVVQALNLGSRNTLTAWLKNPNQIQIKDVVNITSKAAELRLKSYVRWKEDVFAEEYKVIHVREEWHEPHTQYACERMKQVPSGWLIVCQNELCRHFVNDQGESQALSLHNNQMYKMPKPPDHHVIGKIIPIKETA